MNALRILHFAFCILHYVSRIMHFPLWNVPKLHVKLSAYLYNSKKKFFSHNLNCRLVDQIEIHLSQATQCNTQRWLGVGTTCIIQYLQYLQCLQCLQCLYLTKRNGAANIFVAQNVG
jgi:hypothetical protein